MGAFGGAIGDMISQGVQNMHGRIMDVRQFDYQKDLNSQGIQWRVADAIAAGIHPLYALGPTGATYSPVSSSGMSGAGQDITRAVLANMDRKQRTDEMVALAQRAANEDARENARVKAEVNHLNAQTQYVQQQIARLNSAQLGPGMGPGGPSVPPGTVRTVPSEVTSATSQDGPRQAGVVSSYQYARNARGGYVPYPSADVADRMDMEGAPMGFEWWLNNSLLPRFGQPGPPPPFPAAPGMRWRFGADGAWYQERGPRRRTPRQWYEGRQ